MDLARRQLLVPVLAAILGIALVLGSIVLGRSRVSAFMDASTLRAETETATWLGRRAYAVFLEQAPGITGSPERAAPSNPRLWQAAFPAVAAEFAKYPDYRGMLLLVGTVRLVDGTVTGLDEQLQCTAAVTLHADGVVHARVPVANAPEVQMALARSNASHAAERDGLMNFVAFVPVTVAVAAWVAVLSFWYFGRGVRSVLREREQARMRMATLAEAARGIAHEVRNPLNAVSLTLQYMQRLVERRGTLPSEAEFSRIHAELQRVNAVVDGFVRLARADQFQMERLDLGVVLSELEAELRAAPAGIALDNQTGRELWVFGDRARLTEVLRTLLRHLSASAARTITLRCERQHGQVLLRLDVAKVGALDGAVASSPSEGSQVAAGAARSNSPLLVHTLSRMVIEAHDGAFAVESAADGTECVRLSLPEARQ